MVHSGQWKAALVMAGSVMEAILLDQIRKLDESRLLAAVDVVVAREKVTRPVADSTKWHLPWYARVANELGMIRLATREQVLLAIDFRHSSSWTRTVSNRATRERNVGLSACVVSKIWNSKPSNPPSGDVPCNPRRTHRPVLPPDCLRQPERDKLLESIRQSRREALS